jgi:hypothetical protein
MDEGGESVQHAPRTALRRPRFEVGHRVPPRRPVLPASVDAL